MKASYFTNHPLAKAGFFAIPMLLFIVFIERLYPNFAPEGYNSFIIAFEFAQTPNQIHNLLNSLSPLEIEKMNIGNYLDFGLMLSYFLFLVIFLRYISKIITRKWVIFGFIICLTILSADFYENVLLFQLTNIYSPSVSNIELNSILKVLHLVTWIKWGGLSVLFALLSIILWKEKIISSIEGLVGIVPVLLGFVALSNNSLALSWFTLSIFLMFFVLILFSFTYKIEVEIDVKNEVNKKRPSQNSK